VNFREKLNVKLFLYLIKLHATKTFGGSGSIIPRTLNVDSRGWRRAAGFTLWPLFSHRKNHGAHCVRCWTKPEPVWTLCRREKCLPLPGIESECLGHRARSIPSTTTELPGSLRWKIKAMWIRYIPNMRLEQMDVIYLAKDMKAGSRTVSSERAPCNLLAHTSLAARLLNLISL
jgi:hypothetical protein